ncbi:hypothetical protein C8R45DRAFT_1193704 [Mycena sanguinolenta]|nr:hypothetical protein C8R45DRAFT_1193704 [Mycena sanguinolenta]
MHRLWALRAHTWTHSPLPLMEIVGLDEATIAYDHRLHRYFYLAGIVLLLYDNLLTLDLEVRYIWKGWRLRTSAWFLLIRYSSISLRILALLTFDFGNFDPEVYVTISLFMPGAFDGPPNRCKKLNIVKGLLTIIQELFVGCTLILRVLAMYSFNKRILITLVTAAIVCLGVVAWCTLPHGPSPTLPPTNFSGCIAPFSDSQRIRQAGAWEAMLAGDVLLLGLTLYWAYSNSHNIPTGSLWRILIRDGEFIAVLLALISTNKQSPQARLPTLNRIICLANVANILMFYLGDVSLLILRFVLAPFEYA